VYFFFDRIAFLDIDITKVWEKLRTGGAAVAFQARQRVRMPNGIFLLHHTTPVVRPWFRSWNRGIGGEQK